MPTTQSPLWCRARCWRRFSSASLTHDSVQIIDSYHGTSQLPDLDHRWVRRSSAGGTVCRVELGSEGVQGVSGGICQLR